jgi:uncharacterized protein (TIGR03086 family)
MDTDPRTVYAKARAQTAELVAGVKADQLDDPTPCPGYTVRGLLSHLVGGMNRAAHVGEGGNALDVPARVADGPHDGAWADDAKLDELRQVPWGTVPGRGVVAGYVQEVLTHGWDLATATGQPTEGDPELAEYALASARRFLPAEPRGGPIPFEAVVAVPDEAGPYARLAGWLGRQP